tara:strand:- start:130 stop:1191 length:1062 start_codon:yes stop_codon:yes gene_type:complete
MKKNFLISTGGSGGHVLPAKILFDHLSKEADIIISTDKRGSKYFDTNFHKVEIIDTPKLDNIFFLPLNFFLILILTIKSFFLLKNKKIHKIFSTGGYMSLPLILGAKLLRVEIYLLEPNLVLGRANKFFLNSCKKIFCYTKNIKNFPRNFEGKVVVINPLVSEKIYKLKSSQEINKKCNLLIVGGSQGAKIFDNLKNLLVRVSKEKNIKIIQQTSEQNISSLSSFYSKNNIENKVFSFDNDFANIIQKANICITRAGASTLAELSFLHIPFIAVPLPSSKDNHQLENANFYKENNCCWIIEQNKLEIKIEDLLNNILEEKTDYIEKKNNLKKLNFQNSWINVNQKILKNINEN